MPEAAAIETQPSEPAVRVSAPFSIGRLIEYGALLGIWIALMLLFGALSKNFLSAQNLESLANRIPTLAVISAGMTLVLIIGGIDLSVGSLMGFSGALLGLSMVGWHWPLWAAALLCLAAGMAGGALNGTISVAFGIPSFIVTLGMLEAARGLAYLVTDSQTKYIGAAIESVSKPISWLALSPAFLIALAVIVAGQVMLSFSVFGRYLIAIGSNEQAARFSGINPRLPRIAAFGILGLLSGLGALFYSSRLGSSDPNAGIGLELSAIAAVVIGGTSLSGGRGSVINSFFGALIIATLEAGLAQVGASEPSKRIITGAVIIIAVVLDSWRHHFAGGIFGPLKRVLSK
jgi:ribose transport system permease protein